MPLYIHISMIFHKWRSLILILNSNIKEAGHSKSSPVLQNIQFTIQLGESLGLIGPNGAGKAQR